MTSEDFVTDEEAARIRDAVLQQVADNSGKWFDCALTAIPFLKLPETFLGEVMHAALAPIVGHPHHHNTWGSLDRVAVHYGLIEMVGEERPSRKKSSHARMQPLYRQIVQL